MKKGIIALILLFVANLSFAQNQKNKYPFQDTNLSFEQRVDDLVKRLTLEEKVSQMLNSTPAITRFNIPAYDWWNEVLHGVARTPYKVTVFPQAIAMAATFDTTSLHQMADFSALEGRAVHNKAIESGKTGDRYLGLTYWTPNINIFRDPRWGRGQETYGEDPYLTAMLGKAFVNGLQGDDPKYLKAAACAKHYAVHSGPEPSRHVFNADVSNYDLWDTYLPAFKTLVDANVAGVMCAYNAFKGQPCCGSDMLMIDILRNKWNFTGYVTSDCWAIDDFFKNHKTHPDAESASADAVWHGTDIDCGTDAYKSLVSAVKNGKITEDQIDISVKRLFLIRFRLGMFDPVAMVKYAQTPSSVLESKAHQDHALKMAQQSMVLLKNDNILPLNKNIKKIAIIGPNADNAISVLGNYNGTPSKIYTLVDGIKEKLGKDVEIVYEKAINFTNDTLLSFKDLSANFKFEGKQGFYAEYFNNKELSGKPLFIRTESELDHFWQEGEIVDKNLKSYNFSARYTTYFTAVNDEPIIFEIEGDDGYRFLINDEEKVNAWSRNRWGEKTYELKAQKNKTYKLVLEFWQGEGKSNIRLRTGNFVKTNFNQLADRVKDADAILFVGGISPQLEGEEMPVNYPGFNGGDRTSILLPKVQTELMKALKNTGKPVVFVMMTGSAIAIPWEAENIPAIINSWYAGQASGKAIADVLFGDYNPAGRLPVTFYKSDADLPDFNDYGMKGRTYRYFEGEALFPFGYGLSYSKFEYSPISIPSSIKKNETVKISISVKNTSNKAGEEVVQLYINHDNGSKNLAIRSLKGFQRIHLNAGESKTINFSLSPDDLKTINANGEQVLLSGLVNLSVGGGQPAVNIKTTSNVQQASFVIN